MIKRFNLILNRIRRSHLLLVASYIAAGFALYYAIKNDTGSVLYSLLVFVGIITTMVGLVAFYAPCEEGESDGVYTL